MLDRIGEDILWLWDPVSQMVYHPLYNQNLSWRTCKVVHWCEAILILSPAVLWPDKYRYWNVKWVICKSSSGSSGRVGEGARNMKSMRLPLAAIFLWLIFPLAAPPTSDPLMKMYQGFSAIPLNGFHGFKCIFYVPWCPSLFLEFLSNESVLVVSTM